MKQFFLLVAAMLSCTALLGNSSAYAQSAKQKVLELNQQAMGKYTQLEIDAAYRSLEKALRIAQKKRVKGTPLARTYLNMATIQIAGYQSNAKGLRLCVRALEADPDIQLDPLTSTPEVQTIFDLARTRSGAAEKPSSDDYSEPPSEPPGRFEGPGNIPHVPAPEQVQWTAVPVVIDVPEDAEVGPIYVHYKGAKMDAYEKGEMVRIPGGYFGFEIPCEVAAGGAMQYYVEAHAVDGEVIGHAGTDAEPVEVPIVKSRTHPPAALPGHEPPKQCKAPRGACEPGDDDCDSGRKYSCESNSDCEDDERCDDGYCSPAKKKRKGDYPRFVLHLGGAFGAGLAQSGRPADRSIGEDDPLVTGPNAPFIDGGEGTACPQGDICVRVTNPGLVPIFALRGDFGYFFHPRVGASIFYRFQFNTGQKNGFLPSGLMLGARLLVRATKPQIDGFDIVAHLGFSYGELQLQPKQAAGVEKPFIISGLNGTQLGATFSYRFIPNFGVFVTPEMMVQFPTFLFAFDATAGVEVAF